MADYLEGYVEVNERLAAFYKDHPEGRLRGLWEQITIGDQLFIAYHAFAYRDAEDTKPCEGWAWEPFPGKTPYTKDSELMNAETSAWGRALAAMGYEVKRGIASAEEVAARQGDDGPSASQKRLLTTIMRRHQVADIVTKNVVHGIAGDPPDKHKFSQILDRIADKEKTDEQVKDEIGKLISEAGAEVSDIPGDAEGLPPLDERASQEALGISAHDET